MNETFMLNPAIAEHEKIDGVIKFNFSVDKYTVALNLINHNLIDEKLPAIEQVRNAVKEKIGKFTKSEIMEMVPAVGKTSVENSLKAMVENGEIERYGKGKATFYVRVDM